jgi:hypothetical protein
MIVARSLAILIAVAAPTACLLALPGCENQVQSYQPKPAWSGKPVSLPDVPTLPSRPPRVGDAYTISGASHHLRSLVHSNEVKGKTISVVGYVVKTNFGEVPECAVHPTGKADPDNCRPPVPAFWIADEKDQATNAMKVLGFASNFAQLYDAIKRDETSRGGDYKEVTDEFLGIPLPAPIPNVGAKVKVTGTYGFAYTKATSGIETDPRFGVMTYEKIEYIEKPPEIPKLPGMK